MMFDCVKAVENKFYWGPPSELREDTCPPPTYLTEGVKALICALKTWLKREVSSRHRGPPSPFTSPFFQHFFALTSCPGDSAQQRGPRQHQAKSSHQRAHQGNTTPGGQVEDKTITMPSGIFFILCNEWPILLWLNSQVRLAPQEEPSNGGGGVGVKPLKSQGSVCGGGGGGGGSNGCPSTRATLERLCQARQARRAARRLREQQQQQRQTPRTSSNLDILERHTREVLRRLEVGPLEQVREDEFFLSHDAFGRL